MKVEELEVGGRYSLPVSSVIMSEEYFYMGETRINDKDETEYCFEGCAWVNGPHWFNVKQIAEMSYLETNHWRKWSYILNEEKKKRGA